MYHIDDGSARGLRAASEKPYDLILLDLQMPGMDGVKVMDELKEIETDDGYLPVLVVTAQPGHKLRALQAGAKDFGSKPFDLAEVLKRVHNMLEVRLLHKETLNYSKVLEQYCAASGGESNASIAAKRSLDPDASLKNEISGGAESHSSNSSAICAGSMPGISASAGAENGIPLCFRIRSVVKFHSIGMRSTSL